MRKRIKNGTLLLCAVLLCGAFLCGAAAQAYPDLTRTGSILVCVLDTEGTPVPGGELQCFQVAKLTNAGYVPVNGFESSGVSLDTFLSDGTGAAELAKELIQKRPANAKFVSAEPNEAGKVLFSQLELGLYLVSQSVPADRYHALDPFLVTVPLSENGLWIYDIDAAPKVGRASPAPTTTPTTEPSTTPTATPTASTTSTPTGRPISRLPQTGQLRWPVPVLAGMGLVFLLIGWILSKRQEKRNEDSK